MSLLGKFIIRKTFTLGVCITFVLTGCSHLEPENEIIEEPAVPSVDKLGSHLEISGKTIMGYIEWVLFEPEGLIVPSRVDSGATTSSLHAEDLEEFERDGNPWVKFTITDAETDQVFHFEREVVRFVRIIQHEIEAQRRPVVMMEIKSAGIRQRAEFTLADRSNFQYPALLGRNILADYILIHSGETFLHDKPTQ